MHQINAQNIATLIVDETHPETVWTGSDHRPNVVFNPSIERDTFAYHPKDVPLGTPDNLISSALECQE